MFYTKFFHHLNCYYGIKSRLLATDKVLCNFILEKPSASFSPSVRDILKDLLVCVNFRDNRTSSLYNLLIMHVDVFYCRIKDHWLMGFF